MAPIASWACFVEPVTKGREGERRRGLGGLHHWLLLNDTVRDSSTCLIESNLVHYQSYFRFGKKPLRTAKDNLGLPSHKSCRERLRASNKLVGMSQQGIMHNSIHSLCSSGKESFGIGPGKYADLLSWTAFDSTDTTPSVVVRVDPPTGLLLVKWQHALTIGFPSGSVTDPLDVTPLQDKINLTLRPVLDAVKGAGGGRTAFLSSFPGLVSLLEQQASSVLGNRASKASTTAQKKERAFLDRVVLPPVEEEPEGGEEQSSKGGSTQSSSDDEVEKPRQIGGQRRPHPATRR